MKTANWNARGIGRIGVVVALVATAGMLVGLVGSVRADTMAAGGGGVVYDDGPVPESGSSGLPPEQEVRETPVDPTAKSGVDIESAIGGPVIHGTQPTGALSGVVVFTSAGHGWTAGGTEWFTQRPLFLDMCEDYGNIDQLNYFVQYLYNAGATVVPFRPVGYQAIEVVLDNDDAGVTYTGTWNDSTATSDYYENNPTGNEVPYRWATASTTESATARYTPTIPQTDFYPVYCWTRDGTDRVSQTYRIAHSGGVSEVVVDHRRVGKGWIWLGTFYLEAGTSDYVEITNASPDSGVVIADAIRFGNGVGDIVRPGPGTVSGFLREEEASRYWAQSEAGNNAVGLPSGIWDEGGDDQSDNVGTAARWSAYMNRQDVNNDRWRRVYLEFHTNAAGCDTPPCSAKGTVALVSTDYPTTNQTTYATILGDKVEADMLLVDDEFEYPWAARYNPISGGYGAISTYNNDNEFDATILEVAFHDNVDDAANLLNPRVRNAAARSALQGMITFLNGLSGSGVPLAFPPEPPTDLQVIQDASGDVTVSWAAPPSGGANGDPATGYKIYRSTNGYGFDNGLTVGNVLSYVLTDVPAGVTTYIRVAATNAGGESMPTETLGVRVAANGLSRVLLVSGFDRLVRLEDYTEAIPAGAMRRPIWQRQNSFDYAVQHGGSIGAAGIAFDSASNEAVESGAVGLAGYEGVVWILGEELSPFETFSAAEQTIVTNYLSGGGTLFVTGAYLATELDNGGAGQAFYENTLGGDFVSASAGTRQIIGVAGAFLSGIPLSLYGNADAPYDVASADVIQPFAGGTTIINYKGRTTKPAGFAYDAGTYKSVVFGFPFESIVDSGIRDQIMDGVLDFLIAIPGDFDNDGDVDLTDYGTFLSCYNGPNQPPAGPSCDDADFEGDGDVDLSDYGVFLGCYNGPNNPAACP
jgi:hypothetical protein